MTAPLPASLTPPECDLQDFPFMPLHVARLRDSDLASEEDPEACWYAVLLWAASWHQIPAGSLPDNDAILTRFVGLGRDVKTFRKHRSGALRGFVLCDDGRLYHPVVAEQANNSWLGKLKQRWNTECGRIKKQNQRAGTSVPLPTLDEFLSSLPDGQRPLNAPRGNRACPQGQESMSPGTEGGVSREIEVQERGIGIGRGISNKPPNPLEGGVRSDRFAEGWGAFPIAGRGNAGPDKASAEWAGAAERAGGEDALIGAIKAHTARLAADGGRTKNFDRWLRDDGFVAYLDGPGRKVTAWAGPRELRAEVARQAGEEFAKSYLDPAGWVIRPDGPVVVPRTSSAAERLKREDVQEILQRHGAALAEREPA